MFSWTVIYECQKLHCYTVTEGFVSQVPIASAVKVIGLEDGKMPVGIGIGRLADGCVM